MKSKFLSYLLADSIHAIVFFLIVHHVETSHGWLAYLVSFAYIIAISGFIYFGKCPLRVMIDHPRGRGFRTFWRRVYGHKYKQAYVFYGTYVVFLIFAAIHR